MSLLREKMSLLREKMSLLRENMSRYNEKRSRYYEKRSRYYEKRSRYNDIIEWKKYYVDGSITSPYVTVSYSKTSVANYFQWKVAKVCSKNR